MKRFPTLVIAFMMLLLTACGGSESTNVSDSDADLQKFYDYENRLYEEYELAARENQLARMFIRFVEEGEDSAEVWSCQERMERLLSLFRLTENDIVHPVVIGTKL